MGSFGRQDYDDDSRYSFGSSGSPPINCTENGQEILNLSSSMEMNNHNNSSDLQDKLDDSKDLMPLSPDSHLADQLYPQIISAAGGNIIAVANPALVMSPALSEAGSIHVKREVVSPDVL